MPSAVFEPSKPGLHFGPGSRVACLGVKFLEYSLAGMACGFVGQAIANQLMRVKCVPPSLPSCTYFVLLNWGQALNFASGSASELLRFQMHRLLGLQRFLI